MIFIEKNEYFAYKNSLVEFNICEKNWINKNIKININNYDSIYFKENNYCEIEFNYYCNKILLFLRKLKDDYYILQITIFKYTEPLLSRIVDVHIKFDQFDDFQNNINYFMSDEYLNDKF